MQSRYRLLNTCTALLLPLLASCAGAINAPNAPADTRAEPPLAKLKISSGFELSVYARVPNARQMVLSTNGTLFVGTRDSGSVYAVLDKDKDGVGEEVVSVARNLDSPNGVEFRDGSLYVAENSRILRYDNIESRLKSAPKPVVVTDSYPKDRHHGWKYIRFGPDGWLYVPVGAPCNNCESKDPFASITRIKPDGSGMEIFARGVRNTVGFDWDPVSKQMWFTDNGRDWLGDNSPSDELNHAAKAGLNFGFPYYHGRAIADPEFARKRSPADMVPAAFELGPHVAALGMKFYNGTMFPKDCVGDIIYAEHGSWNRAQKNGYRLMRVHMKEGRPVSVEPLVSGFVDSKDKVWGRPVDVIVMADGSLLFSDDFGGLVYRLSYKAPSAGK